MIRYKLVRIINGHYLSANQKAIVPIPDQCLEYVVGWVTRTGSMGVAGYKELSDALTPGHIGETMRFNRGKPIALLKLEPIGDPLVNDPDIYNVKGCYAGGINYQGVKVLEAIPLFTRQQMLGGIF